jgi:hypothetical protein
MDYLKTLDDATLEWFNKAMGEYVSGAFKKDDNGEFTDTLMGSTAEERKECYTRNNIRNRCGLTISNATGQTFRCDDISSFIDGLYDPDDITESNKDMSSFVEEYYDGDYECLEEDIQEQMLQDYKRCLSPRNKSDREMKDSNYGKKLFTIFKDAKFEEDT